MVIDTHTFIWIFLTPEKIPRETRERMREARELRNPLYVSAVTIFEMVYLIEKGVIDEKIFQGLMDELNDEDAPIVCVPFDMRIALTAKKISRKEVPDMPDRAIAATALYLRMPLITKDRKIRASCIETIW